MDEFAQTRGADDLFDDDFTPIAEPEQKTYQPAEEPQQPNAPPKQQYSYDQVPRGPKNATPRAPAQTPRRPSQAPPTPSQPPTSTTTTATTTDDSTPPAQPAPSDASTPRTPRPVPSVRGDRLATGGTLKPKLTEEELTAKLAAAKINNEKRAEAHRLAEADEASFQQREAKATERRKEEGKARRMMDMERERNRLRKLEAGARGGREWDEGKEEQRGEERRGYRRGVNGGLGGYSRGGNGSGTQLDEAGTRDLEQGGRGYGGKGRGRGEGRGRGGGGDRGGGGRGRGGANTSRTPNITEQKAPDPVVDFPALPTGPKQSGVDNLPPDKVGESLKSPTTNGASWADQVNEKES